MDLFGENNKHPQLQFYKTDEIIMYLVSIEKVLPTEFGNI